MKNNQMRKDIIKNIERYLLSKLSNITDINSLYRTLKELSCNDEKINMTNALNKVISGDELKRLYTKNFGFSDRLSSVDAIYKFINNNIYIIEFKSGKVEKKNIYKKAYDTFITLRELEIIKDLNYSINHVLYILVYNKKIDEKINSWYNINNHIYNLTIDNYKNKSLCSIGSFEEYLFKESFACSIENFDKYIVNELMDDEKE